MQRNRRAFTLLELILVLAILVILGALAYPSIEGMYGGVRLRAGADALRGALAGARSHAMDEGRPYRFCVMPSRGNYRVAPDSSAYWGGGATAADDPNNPPLVLEETLPKDIVFAMDDASAGGGEAGGWVPVVTFLPSGEASDDRQFTLRLPGAKPIVVRLRALTGMVTIEKIVAALRGAKEDRATCKGKLYGSRSGRGL
jgi:prepilin-type N-terminal cleavage/methylation domain-containing protein